MKRAVRIPVIANGDIDTPQRAKAVLADTGADGLMIGRAAQGRPWIFREIAHYLATGARCRRRRSPRRGRDPRASRRSLRVLRQELGVRIARKHLGWYTAALPGGGDFRQRINAAETAAAQQAAVVRFFDALAAAGERLQYVHDERMGEALAA